MSDHMHPIAGTMPQTAPPAPTGGATSDRRGARGQIAIWVLVVVAAAAMVVFLVPSWRDAVMGMVKPHEKAPAAKPNKEAPVELIPGGEGDWGLRIGKAAWENLEVNPIEVQRATHSRPMPPQIGTVNFNNDYIATIRPRFPGEIKSFYHVEENLYPEGPPRYRDLSFNDRVKQGDVLAVFWSKDLGMAKAALVDAILAKELSEKVFEQQKKLLKEGSTSYAEFLQAQKQYYSDIAAYNNALRPLIIWDVPRKEVQEVEKEATELARHRDKPRNPEEEIKRWARVELKAPMFAREDNKKPDPTREWVVVEKNVNYDLVDPGRDMPLFKLADLTRLQVWIHPPEEYLPMLREHLNRKPGDADRNGAGLRLLARFQADTPDTPPLELTISRIAPSLDPTLKTPMVIAELKNPDRKYLVGQFVNAIIELPPLPDTVEVPTDAINLVENQNLVFVRPRDHTPENEYFLRRVAVAQTAGKTSLVRSVLTEADKRQSDAEVAKKRRPIETLQPGDWVLTRGAVELTAKLEDLIPPAQVEKRK